MFARNLILATLFSRGSLSATLVPLLAMTLVAELWMCRDRVIEQTVPGTLQLASPHLAYRSVVVRDAVYRSSNCWYSAHQTIWQLRHAFDTVVCGGLVSSAGTTAENVMMAINGNISPALAGSTTVLVFLSSAAVNLPIVRRTAKNKAVLRRLSVEVFTVAADGPGRSNG